MRKACMLNLASCHLNTGQHTHCISECSAVLRDSAHDRKALYRRGQAYLALEDFPQAVRDLHEALERYRLELLARGTLQQLQKIPCITRDTRTS